MLATKNFGEKFLSEIEEILRGMGLDFGMAFDEQGNPIPGSGGSGGANNLGDIKREEHNAFYRQTVVELCNATLKSTPQTGAHHHDSDQGQGVAPVYSTKHQPVAMRGLNWASVSKASRMATRAS